MADKLKITVIMTTYNGGKYVKEQIESILCQTKFPDEILIFDDASKDNTIDIIQYYAQKHKNIKVVINNKNIGWKANFANAITKASGDLIFLSDQDDIWCKDKIEKMVNIMDKNDSIELLASNYKPFYEKNISSKVTGYFYKKYGNDVLVKMNRPKLHCVAFRRGCCCCFRRNLITFFEKLWSENYPHDLVLWEIAAFRGSVYLLNEDLMFCRIHMANSTPRNPKDRNGRINKIVDLRELNYRIFDLKELNLDAYHEKIINKYDMHYSARIAMINHKSLRNILSTLKYINYYPMYRGFIGDLIAK